MMQRNYSNNLLNQVYATTKILRKPISGIIAGYHALPYILITPDDENPAQSIEINGKIDVSPRFLITAEQLSDSFGDVFDPSTFDQEISGRFFSFAYGSKRNLKIKSEYLNITNHAEKASDYVKRVQDTLGSQENVVTALISGPVFHYYPVSIDKFISEILQREMGI
jgi:hypothetical protein